MSGRLTLAELREHVLYVLGDEWATPTELQHRFGLGGNDWYRLCLVLERLANDQYADIDIRGNRRRFRRRATATTTYPDGGIG